MYVAFGVCRLPVPEMFMSCTLVKGHVSGVVFWLLSSIPLGGGAAPTVCPPVEGQVDCVRFWAMTEQAPLNVSVRMSAGT